MTEENWRKGPLADKVDSFLLGNVPRTVPLHSRAVFNWQRWLQLADSPSAAEFSSTLSISQFNSHRILLELWQGRPADQQLLEDIQHYFQKLEDEAEPEGAPKVGDRDYRLPSMDSPSAFQSSIFNLFMWEFFCHTDDEDGAGLFLTVLHDVRREAAIYMACSRLARQCFGPYLGNGHRWDGPSSSAVSLPTEHYQLRSSWMRESIGAGASLEPCAWLKEGLDACGLPYYLWDRLEEKTIPVQELKERPNYIAISHTWGRWKTDEPPISLLGTPWQIPQNRRFDVADLANILQLVPLPHRYIWLDLLCIPQDHSERAKIEISRQATIFREASSTIMWLNDVAEWKYLPAAIEWMCLVFNCDNGFLAIEPEDTMLQGDGTSMSTIELFHPDTEQEAGNNKASLNPWFTSLWTLQEICLRPDMLICNATWEFLAVSENVTVAFDELVALYQANSKADEKRNRYPGPRKPRAVTELIYLLEYTGLSSLLTMSRPTILILGNQRQCLERRAEAIMAVLDATEWFSTSSEDSAEDDLVLNLYPVDFVNEVRAKIGPATFFSSESIEPYFVKILEQFSSLGEVHALGSMLPFGPGLPKFFHDIKSDPNMTPDDSVNTWTVDPTGCVQIKEAVIVSSSREVAPADVMSSFIFGPVIGASNEGIVMPQEDVDLHSWVRAYRPSLPNYAIGIYVSPAGSLGILLKEIVPGVLVKIGSYWENTTASHDIPKSKVVNWVVV